MSDTPATEYNLEDMLTAWDDARNNMERWTTIEKELRARIFNAEFSDPKPGMNKKKISHGMALIGDYKLNYTVDKALLTELSKESVTAGIIASFMTFDPKVSGSKYRDLDVDAKNLVAAMITEKPGLPGIEIKPQSKVRW